MERYLNLGLYALLAGFLIFALVAGRVYAQDTDEDEIMQNIIVFAQDEEIAVSVETGDAVNGYITVHYDDAFSAKAKVLIQKDDTKYYYTINSGSANFPLQMGDGDYTIIVYKNIEDTKYKTMINIMIRVEGLREEVVYTNSIQMVDYEGYEEIFDEINKLLVSTWSEQKKNDVIYRYITSSYVYSKEKAEKLEGSTSYLPDLHDFMNDRKGICYDYSSLFAAVLRSNGIPTKLVMGYRTGVEKYHAWNEVLLNGEWFIIDTTCDAGLIQAGKTVEMIKDRDDFSAVKVY